MPLSHPPGEAQFDFGEATVVIAGERMKAAFAVMTLPFSDAWHLSAYPRECTETFQAAHVAAFEFFGGVPTRTSYDNTTIAVPGWLARRRTGDVVAMVDTRGSRRELHVLETTIGRCVAEVWDTTYIETGATLSCDSDATIVASLPSVAQYQLLHAGDPLILSRDLTPGVPWRHGQPGHARIGCTLSAAFTAAQVGQRIILDDGKLTGTIEHVGSDELLVRILTADPNGSRLRAEKGINLPDTDLGVAAVTDADLALVDIAAAHADMVALSFLRHERDVDDLRVYLRRADAAHLGLILKIETTAAFTRLPEILLHAAVEAGYERLAEVQEEIPWLCEAAHLPVIWATEVLDKLARTGQPSRAEITDAAMAQRAECVMLNKGPHVDTAIVVLDEILRRMSGHQRKRTALLRPLRAWADND